MKKTGSHENLAAGRKKPVEISGIPVHCKFDRICDAEELTPHPDNAHRSHPPKQLEKYEIVIAGKGTRRGNGWRKPVVVSKFSGFIIRGHGAWLMAKRRGWKIPVEYQAYKDRAEERRDLLADNRLAEEALTDNAKLAKLLSEMDEEDLSIAAFSSDELQKLLSDADTREGDFPITAKLHESYDYVLVFTENESDFVFLQTLCGVQTERSYKKTGVGLGRAIPFKRFLEAIRQNRHSLDVQGGDHDDARPHSKRDGVRAAKPIERLRPRGQRKPAHHPPRQR
jgi:hypothetical protein